MVGAVAILKFCSLCGAEFGKGSEMILKQYYLGCLAHASYLLGDEETGTAVVVDPQRDTSQYQIDAKHHGLQIRHVFLTHFHADFVAGHLELRDQTGARIHLGARAQAQYDFTPMGDGESLQFGRLRLQVLETPGHTPEGISILVYDLRRDGVTPYAVLTGDTSSGPHHQDSGEAKIRESTAGVSRKPSSDCKACGCSSKHLCGLTAWNT